MGAIEGLWLGLAAAGAAIWLCILVLPWQPWRVRERLEAASQVPDADLSRVTVLIPARNEAAVIGETLAMLGRQGRGLRAILVDDHSEDGTAARARQSAPEALSLEIFPCAPLPAGWAGKTWALEQGRSHIETPLTLLLDADIALAPGTLPALLAQKRKTGAALVSLMARLRMAGGWEKLLMPAFVFFFRLLYPFHLSNGSGRLVAASAGGCVLAETAALAEIGGFGAIRSALIDDCALARAIKARGLRTWIGVSHDAMSLRAYGSLGAIWRMVARSAYTQLRYSPGLLLLCTLLMALAFWMPPLALAVGPAPARIAGGAGLAAMLVCYLPTLLYYRLPPHWSLPMPLIGTLYLAMTWHSAVRAWTGQRSEWKGRVYTADLTPDR